MVIKYWTVQSQEVLQILEKENLYCPRFALSQYYKKYYELYDFLLQSFNNINNLKCEGLVYAFCVSVKDRIYSIENIERFRQFININKSKIVYLWDEFIKNNYKILGIHL